MVVYRGDDMKIDHTISVCDFYLPERHKHNRDNHRDELGNATFMYYLGNREPHFPVPAIPQIHQWDYSLWCFLESLPVMSDDEWEREEEEYQDYLDSLE